MSDSNKKLSFIGAGNMAAAILAGLTGFDICLFDIDPEKYKRFENCGYRTASSAADAVEFADIVIFSVVPQSFDSLLTEIRNSGVSLDSKLYISIAAGIKISSICEKLAHELPVVRVMPNSGLKIGKGVTALSRNTLVSDEQFRIAESIFSVSGICFVLPEEQMNEIISVTGSAPAYVYMLVKAINDSAISQGLDIPNLPDIICRMIIGSAETLLNSEMTVDELISEVATPRGTTIEAVKVLNERGFCDVMDEAMKSCTRRAKELSDMY